MTEFWIKHSNLIDFPYNSAYAGPDSPFSFDQEKVDNLVSEIMLASPTCYLVSGYRGAGKTSFIRRVQEGCLAQASFESEGQKGVLFVYSSFSRFETKTYFLRRLIRDLHEAATGWESKNGEVTNKDLKTLYAKTFQAIKREHSKSTETNTSTELSLDPIDYLGKLVKAFLPLLGPVLCDILLPTGWQHAITAFTPYSKLLVYAGFAAWTIFNTIKVTFKYSIKKSESDKYTVTNLADDEITEYDLEYVLDELSKKNFKVVFVLDELDKIEDTERDQLLREMKPWLVKGKADFILVAGQQLTMKYYRLKERDDEILASLFSRVIHIHPLTEQQFSRLFKDFLIMGVVETGNPPEQKPLEEFTGNQADMAVSVCNSIIYRSKRLPRTFMNLIRQELQWRDGHAFLPVPDVNFKVQETKMIVLRRIFEKLAINAEVSETGKSHIIMQLFRAASMIREKGTKELIFDRMFNYVINPDNKVGSTEYPYPDILPTLTSCLQELYAEALKEKLVIQPVIYETFGDNEMTTPKGGQAVSDPKRGELQNFITDFNTFVQMLQRMSTELLSSFGNDGENTRLDKLFAAFTASDIIHLPFSPSTVLEYPVSYYRSKLNQPKAFLPLYDFFTRHEVSFYNLFNELYRNFTVKKLITGFNGFGFIKRDNAKDESKRDKYIADYKVLLGKRPDEFTLLVDYKYIEGTVAVTHEEISRAIDMLEDYNISTAKGNYYLSVVFFKNYEGLDATDLSLSVQYQIEKFRPDLASKIRYIIIPIFNFEQLPSSLSALSANLTEYSLIPVSKRDWPKPTLRNFGKKNIKGKLAEDLEQPQTDTYDIQKGKWGGNAISNGRKLSAVVVPDTPGWFKIHLKIESPPNYPLKGKVTFYLNESFIPEKYTVLATEGEAEVKYLTARKAFTVGVSCDNNTTHLELDLNTLPNAPKAFKYRN